jgi:hypothetical protein
MKKRTRPHIYFKIGEKAVLDQGFSNSCLVEIVSQTPRRLFTKIRCPGKNSDWEVNTLRLSKIEPDEKGEIKANS